MKVLIIEHAPARAEGIDTQVVSSGHVPFVWRPYLEEVKPNLPDFQALIVSGGPMGAYETAKYPFFAKELPLLEQALTQKIPFFGICLGAQLVVQISGGLVEKTFWRRGFMEVCPVSSVKSDGFLRGLDDAFPTFEWHQDEMTKLPTGTTVLMNSDNCAVEAFRFNNQPFWGVQFHPEVRAAKAQVVMKASGIPDADSEKLLRLSSVAGIVNNDYLFRNFLEVAQK